MYGLPKCRALLNVTVWAHIYWNEFIILSFERLFLLTNRINMHIIWWVGRCTIILIYLPLPQYVGWYRDAVRNACTYVRENVIAGLDRCRQSATTATRRVIYVYVYILHSRWFSDSLYIILCMCIYILYYSWIA